MRKILIGIVVFLLLATIGLGAYYYIVTNQSKNPTITNVPVGQRGVGQNVNINVGSSSEYSNISINISDKTLLSTYLSQFDFWNRDIPYYNSINKKLITKFRPTTVELVLAQNQDATYPFKVGDLGSFNGYYDLQDQPGPLILNVFIDPNQVNSMTEEDLAKRFSTIALSALQFFAQNANPVSAVQLVEPPAPFVTITRINLASPTPVILPQGYPEDQDPPGFVPENPNNNASLE